VRAGARGAPGDGLWSDEPLQPMLAMSADCLPIAVARVDGLLVVGLLRDALQQLVGGGKARRPRAHDDHVLALAFGDQSCHSINGTNRIRGRLLRIRG